MERMGGSDCERLRPGAIAQPVNTLTSLGYLVAGAAVVRRADPAHRTSATALAGMLALVGMGSVAFHGPQPPGARLMHDLPIAGLLGVIGLVPAARRGGGRAALPGWTGGRGLALAGLAAASGLAYLGGRTGSCTCDPDSPLQLHGAWHLLSATGFVVVADILVRPVVGR